MPPETRQDGYYQKKQKACVSEAVKTLLVRIPLPPTAGRRITTCSIDSTSGDAVGAASVILRGKGESKLKSFSFGWWYIPPSLPFSNDHRQKHF